MVHTTALAEIGALIGDAGRANMLAALLDGRALTAKELADHAGVTPQTASGHLAKLTAGHLVVVEKQGRHRFHRLASAEVARMIETMMQMAAHGDAARNAKPIRVGPRDQALRAARTCYDHLAGRLGVALADAMAQRDLIRLDADGGLVTPEGRQFLSTFGLDVDAAPRGKRVLCRPCLDWSERRPHLAGVVGAQIMQRCFNLGWIRRLEGTRAVAVTPSGQEGFRRVFDVRPG
ncbi:MAG: helix-turn-helix transcriptional regulator [Proteobacteria bacterium]|nr:helix-turn-helix transcriptional regulator [Pseudomonadota bacterium]